MMTMTISMVYQKKRMNLTKMKRTVRMAVGMRTTRTKKAAVVRERMSQDPRESPAPKDHRKRQRPPERSSAEE